MTAFDRIPDHPETIPGLLLTQFRDKPRIEALARALTSGAQALEDATFEVATERALSAAVGVQLDGIGEIVGRPRGGLNDDVYRAVIRAQVRVLVSSGRAEELLTIARRLVGGDGSGVRWRELYPAAGVMELDAVPDVPPQIMISMLQAARSGGVRLQMTYPPDDETEAGPFTYAEGDTEEESGTDGWANLWGPDVFDDASLYLPAFTVADDLSEWPTLQGRVATATQSTPGDRPSLRVHDPAFGLLSSIRVGTGEWFEVPHHADLTITASGLYIAALIESTSQESGDEYIATKWAPDAEWAFGLTTGAPFMTTVNSSGVPSAALWGSDIRDGLPHIVEGYHDGDTTAGVSVDAAADVTITHGFRAEESDVQLFALGATAVARMGAASILILPRMPSSGERDAIRAHLRNLAALPGATAPGGRFHEVIE